MVPQYVAKNRGVRWAVHEVGKVYDKKVDKAILVNLLEWQACAIAAILNGVPNGQKRSLVDESEDHNCHG